MTNADKLLAEAAKLRAEGYGSYAEGDKKQETP
jgi:hypothetical protein